MKWILILLVVTLAACTNLPSTPGGGKDEDKKPEPSLPVSGSYFSLSWESTTEPHPERAPWSEALSAGIDKDLALYENSDDITVFCPKFQKLDRKAKIKAVGELFVAVAYYESGYNPKSTYKEPFSTDDKNTWSVGLYQVTVNDRQNSKKYTYEQLITPIPNIDLALTTMRLQLEKTGRISLNNSSPNRYWSVLLIGNKNSKIDGIKARVVSKAPGC